MIGMKLEKSFDYKIFEKAVEFTLRMEGELSKDKDDPGGLTKYGISKKQYPYLNIEELTLEEAIGIYYRDYWKKIKCDEICRVNPKVAIIVFDTHVNTGRGISILQFTLNQHPLLETKLKIDNIFGPKTLNALSEICVHSSSFVIYNYLLNRISYYARLTKMKKFFYGWVRRVLELKKYIENLNIQEV